MTKLCYLIALFFASSCTRNLVRNPGAETLPFTNEWTIASGKWTQRVSAPAPREGKAYFFPSVAANAELFQDVDISGYKLLMDLGLINVHFESYMRVFPQRPSDQSYEIVEFRDGNNSVLDSITTPHIDSANAWVRVSYSKALPKGTRTIRVRLLSDRYNGSNNDGYHDGISLSISFSWWLYAIAWLLAFFLIVRLWLRSRWRRLRKEQSSPDVQLKTS